MSEDPQQGCVAGPPTNFREYLMGGSLFPRHQHESGDNMEERGDSISTRPTKSPSSSLNNNNSNNSNNKPITTTSTTAPPPVSARLKAFAHLTISVLFFCIIIGRLAQTLINIEDYVGVGHYWIEAGPCWTPFGILDVLFVNRAADINANSNNADDYDAPPKMLDCDQGDDDWMFWRKVFNNFGITMSVFVAIGQIAKKFFLMSPSNVRKIQAVLSLAVTWYLHAWGFFILIGVLSFYFVLVVYIVPLIIIIAPKRVVPVTRQNFPAGGKVVVDLLLIGFPTLVLLAAQSRNGFISGFLDHFGWLSNFARPAAQIMWHDTFRFQVLRMISFGYDYLEYNNNIINSISIADGGSETPAPASSFTFINFISYSLYIPLYATGPFCSFNTFIATTTNAKSSSKQSSSPSSFITNNNLLPKAKSLLAYAFSILMACVALSGLIALVFLNSIVNQPQVLQKLPLFDQTAIIFLLLLFLFLKQIIAWRFFRFFAILDDVDTPEEVENSLFIFSSFSATDFCRQWNASFHQFAVKYLYVPFGGKQNKVFLIFPILMLSSLWLGATVESFVFAVALSLGLLFDHFILCSSSSSSSDQDTTMKAFLGTISMSFVGFAFSYGFGVGAFTIEVFENIVESLTKFGGFGVLLFWIVFGVCSRHVAKLNQELESNKRELEK